MYPFDVSYNVTVKIIVCEWFSNNYFIKRICESVRQLNVIRKYTLSFEEIKWWWSF